MAKPELLFNCPACGKEVTVHAEMTATDLAPTVRCKMRPSANVYVYKITSEDIKQFIIDKANKLVPGIKVDVVPRYCERKRQRKNEPHRSYASLRIAFSDDALEKRQDDGWYGTIGDTNSNVRIVKSLFDNLITKYQYNRKEVDAWLKSYKTLEELEEALGMTDAYINDLRNFCVPQRIVTQPGTPPWIIFSAAAENVIEDMLSDVETGKPEGRIRIQDVYQVSRDSVEFIVHVQPGDMQMRENPHVRSILMGEEKVKK